MLGGLREEHAEVAHQQPCCNCDGASRDLPASLDSTWTVGGRGAAARGMCGEATAVAVVSMLYDDFCSPRPSLTECHAGTLTDGAKGQLQKAIKRRLRMSSCLGPEGCED